MTNGPWNGEARPKGGGGRFGIFRTRRLEIVITLIVLAIAIAVVTMMPAEWTRFAKDDPRVGRSEYSRLAEIARGCPAARTAIRRTLMDGYATRSEFDAVLKVANARVDDYLEANARNDAAIASGAPAVRTPPRCMSS